MSRSDQSERDAWEGTNATNVNSGEPAVLNKPLSYLILARKRETDERDEHGER